MVTSFAGITLVLPNDILTSFNLQGSSQFFFFAAIPQVRQTLAQVVHEQKVKDPLNSTCQFSSYS